MPAELCAQYFDVGANARYLATVGRVRPEHREQFAAAILAGDLVRVHAVDRDENPLYWKLLHAAGKRLRAAGALQHFVQPLRRAAGVYAARRGAQLLFIGDRCHAGGELLPREVTVVAAARQVDRRRAPPGGV